MDDDSRVIDKGWDALPEYGSTSGDADDAVTVSISTTPGEWLVNTVDAVVVPMSMAEVVEAIQHHKLTDRSLVWRAGMQEWAPVDKVPQLKLAARMSPVKAAAPSAAPPRPVPASTPTASKPPPKPLRATPALGTVAPDAAPPQAIPSRKATLPFGLTAPKVTPSRPAGSRPSQPSQARVALPPTASKEEPEVLAVYDRPAATISFDLSPAQPLRSAPPSAPAPQTLAPTTTDSAQRRAPAPRNADLSVVAASDFRQVQRSSKRLVLISSLASAAAASLVTFALSRGHTANTAAATPSVVAAPVAAAPPVATPPSATPPVAPTPPPSATPEPAPSDASAPAPVTEKPKASARKARAVSVAPRPRPEAVVPAATRDPASEPNPYDVKLDEETPSATPAPAAAHGSGLEADNDVPQASSNSNTSPGF
ncbi:MAG TPA: GYF domain-containing protein [Polyangiaceae bacterium]|nr:GYF domain-containing protein [Polyangiaceae bacterium]